MLDMFVTRQLNIAFYLHLRQQHDEIKMTHFCQLLPCPGKRALSCWGSSVLKVFPLDEGKDPKMWQGNHFSIWNAINVFPLEDVTFRRSWAWWSMPSLHPAKEKARCKKWSWKCIASLSVFFLDGLGALCQFFFKLYRLQTAVFFVGL